MDTLLGYVPELLGAAAAAWQWRKARRAQAAKVAADVARAALEVRLTRVADIASRFAEALERGDLEAMRRIEAERKREGL